MCPTLWLFSRVYSHNPKRQPDSVADHCLIVTGELSTPVDGVGLAVCPINVVFEHCHGMGVTQKLAGGKGLKLG